MDNASLLLDAVDGQVNIILLENQSIPFPVSFAAFELQNLFEFSVFSVLQAYLKAVNMPVSDVDLRCQLPIMTWNCWMNLQLARMQSSCGIRVRHQLNYPFWIDRFEWYRYQRSNDKSHWTTKSPGSHESLKRIQIGVNRYIGMQELPNFITRLSTTASMQLHLSAV